VLSQNGVGLTGGLGVLCQTRDHGPRPMLIRGDPLLLHPSCPVPCLVCRGTWYFGTCVRTYNTSYYMMALTLGASGAP
jgi:hypothetical protein